jgi:hypothetical protein
MGKRRQKKGMFAKVILIMAFLFMVAGANVASAGNMGQSALLSAYANYYQGFSQYYSALALLDNSNSYQYTAAIYMDEAFYNTDWADYYASFYTTSLGYNAYLWSLDAYDMFDAANYYAYYAYYYANTTYSLYALYFGGLASSNATVSLYYAAMDSVGGIY